MLGDFFYAAGQGLAQAGHGPGSFGRGLGAGLTALPQLQQQQQLMDIQRQQAQAMQEYRKAQAESLTPSIRMVDPNGNEVMVPPAHVGQALAAQYRLAGSLGSAAIGAQSRESVANITQTGRMDIEKMKALIASGQVARIMPVQTPDGQTVMRAFNKFLQPLGDIEGGIPPSSYLGKTSSTVEYKQLDDGSIVALPKTTTTTPNVPGRSQPKGGGGGGAGGIQVQNGVVTQGGQPVVGKGAVTSATRTMVETAPKVTDLVERIKTQINDLEESGQLGPAMSRWNELWSGKVGAENPKFRALMTNTTLLSTLLMRMHLGSRGGQQIMQHFEDMIGAGHQSAANMRATMDEIETYANDVKGATPLPSNFGKSNKGAATPGGVIRYDQNGNRL
jgi:hypothetical protein